MKKMIEELKEEISLLNNTPNRPKFTKGEISQGELKVKRGRNCGTAS
jgi:hypothetical protein